VLAPPLLVPPAPATAPALPPATDPNPAEPAPPDPEPAVALAPPEAGSEPEPAKPAPPLEPGGLVVFAPPAPLVPAGEAPAPAALFGAPPLGRIADSLGFAEQPAAIAHASATRQRAVRPPRSDDPSVIGFSRGPPADSLGLKK
jgi:hypothetical protein